MGNRRGHPALPLRLRRAGVGGMAKVLLTALWPGAAGFWAALAVKPVAAMRWAVEHLALLPGSDVPVPPPASLLMAVFYLLVLSALLSNVGPGMRWILRTSRVAAAGCVVILPLGRELDRRLSDPGETRITVLAVGAGQCAVVQPPGGRTVLVDAGSSSLADLVGRCLGPFLRHTRCTQIDTVVMSHGDWDHVSGVEDVVRGVRRPRGLDQRRLHVPRLPRLPAGRPAGSPFPAGARPPRVMSPGDVAPLGRDTFVEVLWPPTGAAASPHPGRVERRLPGRQADPRRPQRPLPRRHPGPRHAGTAQGPGQTQVRRPGRRPPRQQRIPDGRVRERRRPGVRRQLQRPHFEQQAAASSKSSSATVPSYRTNRCGAITIVISREGELRVETFLGK